MAANIRINQEHAKQRMSHNNVCAKALEDHTPEELNQLAIVARRSNNPALLRCFTDLPSLDELTDSKVASEQAAVVKPTVPTKPKTITGVDDAKSV